MSTTHHPTHQKHSQSHSHDPYHRHRLRLKLRIASLTLTLLSLLAFSISIPTWQSHFFHASGPLRGDWTDILPLIPLVLILLTDLCIVSHTVRRRQPPAAKAVATIESLLLLLLTPALTLAVLGSLFLHFSAAVPGNDGQITCSALQNFLSRECSPSLYTVGSLQLLGVVFGWMVWLLHVGLALWGAMDVRRSRLRSAKEEDLEEKRRRWHEGRGTRQRTRQRTTRRREFKEVGGRTGTGAYETYGWYR